MCDTPDTQSGGRFTAAILLEVRAAHLLRLLAPREREAAHYLTSGAGHRGGGGGRLGVVYALAGCLFTPRKKFSWNTGRTCGQNFQLSVWECKILSVHIFIVSI